MKTRKSISPNQRAQNLLPLISTPKAFAIVAFLWFAGLSFVANGQDHFQFGHLTVSDGLSQSQAYCMLQDSYGYLWIGTQDGLNRFDGYELKVYKNDPFDSTTLTHNWVWAIEEDNDQNLWVGTFQGLCKYDRRTGRFQQFYHDPKDSASISGNRPNCILKDKRGRLWISSWGSGLNLLDPATGKFKQFLTDPDDENAISSNAVRTLLYDHLGNIWVGTWNAGLSRVIEDEDGIRFRRYKNMGEGGIETGNRITSMAEDHHGNLWIASYESGLLRFDPQKQAFSRMPGFAPDDVNEVMRDRNNNLWVGTNNGLVILNPATGRTSRYTHDVANPKGISSNTVYTLYEDRTGSVWMSGNGLDIYHPNRNIFKSYAHIPSQPNSLGQNHVWSFCEDNDGLIWIGTESGPLNVFNPATRTFRHVTLKDNDGNLAQNIHKIIHHNGVFWIASFISGLIRYEPKTGDTRFFFGKHPSALGKASEINDVIFDHDGSLWITTYDRGIIHYDPQTETVETFRQDANDPSTIGSNFVNCLLQDARGNIWIGFWGGGMSMYNRVTRKFTTYRYDRKNPKGLSDQVVNSIVQESDSIFWVGTQTGLDRFNTQTRTFEHFFEKDGLPNNVVYNMLKDASGKYWISTNQGLSRFDPIARKFKNFGVNDGLQSNEFNANAALKSSSGDFYFGGVQGFNVFRPEHIKGEGAPAHLVIQSFKVFEQERPLNGPVTLSHNENFLSFRFAAIEFESPEKIRYAYRLDGFDMGWTESANNRFAGYTNLDPGHYVFRVKAANADGYWNPQEATVAFTIAPPFWKTWWFVASVLVVCASLIYSIHRYRLAQSLQVERLRNKIASDLHDEVGSSLTRISIYSDLLQNGVSSPAQTGTYLKSISDMSREIVGTMSDIVWSIDNRNDTTGALILRMRDFATEVLQARNIALTFTQKGIDENRILDPALKQNLYLIFKESVNNIVKHAHARHVRVSLTNEGDTFCMRIDDDGTGFSTRETHQGNGLRNMNRRAGAIGGTFQITHQAGTSIVVTRKAL